MAKRGSARKAGGESLPAYRVVGSHPVHGCRRGQTFRTRLTPAQEAALIEGGHVVRVAERTTQSEEVKEDGEAGLY